MSDLKQFLPWLYKDVVEMDALMKVEDNLFSKLMDEYIRGRDNQYILTADEYGIRIFEDIINIVPDPATETLEFRRARLISRFRTQPPFTFRWLQGKLNEVIGVGKWNAWVDNENYTLYIESTAEDQKWLQEITITIGNTKPANIVFINRPLVVHDVLTNETINLKELIWNYRLGVSWKLGEKPFISYTDKGVIVLATTPSIQQTLLNKLATFTVAEIAKVRINDSYIVTDFEIKSASANVATIQYYVMPESGITNVTRIELLDSANNVLTRSNVYIPLVLGVNLKHTILVKEG